MMVDTLLLRPSIHFTTLHPTTLHYTCRHFTSSHLNFTQLLVTILSFGLTPFKFLTVQFHPTSLHFKSLHFTALLGDFCHNSIAFISWLTLYPPSPTSPHSKMLPGGWGKHLSCMSCVFTYWAIPDLVYSVELKVTRDTSQVIHSILSAEVILAVTVSIIASCYVTRSVLWESYRANSEEHRQCACLVTIRRIRVNIIAVDTPQ